MATDRKSELGTAYRPNVEKDQSLKEFETEELKSNGVTLDDLKNSDYFKSGDFSKQNKQNARIAKEMGFKEPEDASSQVDENASNETILNSASNEDDAKENDDEEQE